MTNCFNTDVEMMFLELLLEAEYLEAKLTPEKEFAFAKIREDHFLFEDELVRQKIRDKW